MKNNMRLISVVMGADTADNRTTDTVKLLNYGFNTYKLAIIYKKDKEIDTIKVEKGKKESAKLILLNDATELLNVLDKPKKYTINVKVDKIVAPIKKGQKVGIAEIIDNEGKIVTKVGLTIKNDIKKANLKDYFKRNFKIVLAGKNFIK